MAFEVRLQFSNWQRRIRFSAMFVVNWQFLFAKPFLWLENIKIIQTHFKLKSERRCLKATAAKNRAFYRIIGYYCAQCSGFFFFSVELFSTSSRFFMHSFLFYCCRYLFRLHFVNFSTTSAIHLFRLFVCVFFFCIWFKWKYNNNSILKLLFIHALNCLYSFVWFSFKSVNVFQFDLWWFVVLDIWLQLQ